MCKKQKYGENKSRHGEGGNQKHTHFCRWHFKNVLYTLTLLEKEWVRKKLIILSGGVEFLSQSTG